MAEYDAATHANSKVYYDQTECDECGESKMSNEEKRIIVGICGLIGAGKDAAADVLVNEYGFTRLSFADSVKDVLVAVFGWDREMLEGSTEESRAARNEVDEWWSTQLGYEVTPRNMMQKIGTDLFRKHFFKDIWVRSLENKLRDLGNIVISDVRFPNEIDMIRKNDGYMWEIRRGEKPEWYILADRYNTADRPDRLQMEKLGLTPEYYGAHKSEWAWIGQKMDTVIQNDGSLADLQQEIRNQAEFLFPKDSQTP